MDIPWGNVGDFLKAAAPVVGAVTSIGTLVVVGMISQRQSRTAQDKLTLDLFDRRFETWKQFSDALTVCLDYADGKDAKDWTDYLAHWRQLDRAALNARFLFGPDVADRMSDLSEKLMVAPWNSTDADGTRESFGAWAGYTKWQIQFSLLGDEIFDLVKPYMKLDEIAVARPGKPFRLRLPIRKKVEIAS